MHVLNAHLLHVLGTTAAALKMWLCLAHQNSPTSFCHCYCFHLAVLNSCIGFWQEWASYTWHGCYLHAGAAVRDLKWKDFVNRAPDQEAMPSTAAYQREKKKNRSHHWFWCIRLYASPPSHTVSQSSLAPNNETFSKQKQVYSLLAHL